ncbi:hypothetical protein FBU30_009174 [Linnemannia zychae]|nr:hypothetical protein FBU30_009174 [Linnemannia zychae]
MMININNRNTTLGRNTQMILKSLVYTARNNNNKQGEAIARRGSRPSSMNILPESLTSVNNHAFHEETANIERKERVRHLSEDERQSENISDETSPSLSGNTMAVAASVASRPPAALSLGRVTGARFGRSGSGGAGSLTQISPTTPTTTNPYGTLTGRPSTLATTGGRQLNGNNAPHRLSLTGITAAFAKQQIEDTAASPSTPTQSQYVSKLTQPISSTTSTLSRNGSRSSPPTSVGLRRPGFATHQQEQQHHDLQRNYNDGSVLSSLTDQHDEYYRLETELQMQQQPVRSGYLRQQQQRLQQDLDQPEWRDHIDDDDYNNNDGEPARRIPTTSMRSSRSQLSPTSPILTLAQQQQQQREKHQQRLRIQQQALEEVYGHGSGSGYGSTFPDDQGEFIDDQPHRFPPHSPQRQRYQSQLSPRHQRDSLHLGSPTSPMPVSPRDYHSMNAATPKAGPIPQHSRYSPPMPSSGLPLTPSGTLTSRTSEHYRRQSKDGYSLMSAPRISPPLAGLPTVSTVRTPSSSNQLANSRRSFSQGISGSNTLPSRRLSTAANVGSLNDSLGNSNSIGLHGRSGSSGSLQRPLSGNYSTTATISQSGLRAPASAYSDGNMHSMAGSRRPLSTMMNTGGGGGNLPQSTRRSASDSLGNGARLSTNASSSSNSEYARVFNPRPSVATNGGSLYQQQQKQHDTYNYRPEVPIRQSSLGAGSGVNSMGGAGNGSYLSSRASMTTLRSGSSSALQGLSGSTSSMSSSHLRRAASMNVTSNNGLGVGVGGGSGSGSLGRASGLLPAASVGRSSYQQPPQMMQMPQQRYQRTSVYSHRS